MTVESTRPLRAIPAFSRSLALHQWPMEGHRELTQVPESPYCVPYRHFQVSCWPDFLSSFSMPPFCFAICYTQTPTYLHSALLDAQGAPNHLYSALIYINLSQL